MPALPLDSWMIGAIAFALLSAAFTGAAVVALRRRRVLGSASSLLVALLLLAIAASSALLSIGTQGYRALTKEEVAAVIEIEPTGEQAFRATFRFPDETTRTFELRGDQVYVDARILKWKPLANLVGLHTQYELDRVAGRYRSIEDARTAPRTVRALGQDKPVDIFKLRERFPVLEPLVDAEYGSATFVSADEPVRLELRVSTSGLLMRKTPERSP